MTRSPISIFVLVVSLLWAVVVSWFFVAVGGAANLNPAYLGKALLWFSWLFIGPLLLLAGAVLTLIGRYQKAGSILSLLACCILSFMVGYQVLSVLRDLADPLIAKPPYVLYAIAVALTVLADAGAVQLFRLASLGDARRSA
jgi:hypothetical protein